MLHVWSVNIGNQKLQKHVTPGFRNVFYRYGCANFDFKQAHFRHEYKKFSINGKEYKVEYKALPVTHAQNKNPYRVSQNFEILLGDKTLEGTEELRSFPNLQLVTLERNSEQPIYHHPRTGDRHGIICCTINGIRGNYFVHQSVATNTLHVQSSEILGRPYAAKEIPKLQISFGEAQNTNMIVYVFFSPRALIPLRAQMTGKIVSVLTAPKEEVNEGDVVMIMESMKMETKIRAPRDGTVKEVFVNAGQVVEEGSSLLLFE